MCYNLLIVYTCRHRQEAYRFCAEAGTRFDRMIMRFPCRRITTTTHDVAALCGRCKEELVKEFMGSEAHQHAVAERAADATAREAAQMQEEEQAETQAQTKTRSRRSSVSVAVVAVGKKIRRVRSGWKKTVRFSGPVSSKSADRATQTAPHADPLGEGNPRRVVKGPHFKPPILSREERFRPQQPTLEATSDTSLSFAEHMAMEAVGRGRPPWRPERTLEELETRHTPTSSWSTECGSQYEGSPYEGTQLSPPPQAARVPQPTLLAKEDDQSPAADDAQQAPTTLPARDSRPSRRRRRSHRIIIPRPPDAYPLSPYSSLGLISDDEDMDWMTLRSISPPVDRLVSQSLNAADHLDTLFGGADNGSDDETNRDEWSYHGESAIREDRKLRSGPRRGRRGSERGAGPAESDVVSVVTGSQYRYRSESGIAGVNGPRGLGKPCSPSRAKYTFFGGYESDDYGEW